MAAHLEFTYSDQEAFSNGIKVCVYSPAGHGKTVLVSTLPKCLLISAESGLLSLSKNNLNRIWGPDRPDICYSTPTIKVNSLEGMIQAYNYCISKEAMEAFDTFAIDSITEIAEKILQEAKARARDPRQAYGEMMDEMFGLLKKYRDIPGKHIYMSAKMEAIVDHLNGGTRWTPKMPGQKVGPEVPYMFDEVLALRNIRQADGSINRVLQTQPDQQYEAKDRSGSLNPQGEFPHMGMIFNKILSGV